MSSSKPSCLPLNFKILKLLVSKVFQHFVRQSATVKSSHPIGDPKMPDVVIEWNNVYLDAIRKVGGAPTPIARAGAMMHAAMYDAINSIAQTHQPYLISLPTPIETAAKAAAAYAAHRVLRTIYPSLKPLFDQALTASLTTIQLEASPSAIENGRILGEAVANVVIANRINDQSDNQDRYVPGTNPGDWQPTGSGEAVTPYWSRVRPFTMNRGSQFRPIRPGGFATRAELLQSPEYAAQLNEVKRLGSKHSTERTAEQTEIAYFWANDLNNTYKPPGHLYRLTQIVSDLKLLSLTENARLFALVALALADAGIIAWDAKYSTEIDLWRPETAIREADRDGNPATDPDPQWEPLSNDPTPLMMGEPARHFSPAFPAYVSGHATFGAAHAGIMRNFFDTDEITFELDTEDPNAKGVTRTFNSFSAAALENGRSRVYLGVHYQWDADSAYLSGTRLADYVFTNFLTPVC
jgi:hypothetical protein